MGRTGRTWTRQMDAVVKKYTTKEASERLGIPIPSISTRRRTLGLDRSPGSGSAGKKYTRQYLLDLLKKCAGSKSRMAEAMGVSRQAVHRLLDRYGITL